MARKSFAPDQWARLRAAEADDNRRDAMRRLEHEAFSLAYAVGTGRTPREAALDPWNALTARAEALGAVIAVRTDHAEVDGMDIPTVHVSVIDKPAPSAPSAPSEHPDPIDLDAAFPGGSATHETN